MQFLQKFGKINPIKILLWVHQSSKKEKILMMLLWDM